MCCLYIFTNWSPAFIGISSAFTSECVSPQNNTLGLVTCLLWVCSWVFFLALETLIVAEFSQCWSAGFSLAVVLDWGDRISDGRHSRKRPFSSPPFLLPSSPGQGSVCQAPPTGRTSGSLHTEAHCVCVQGHGLRSASWVSCSSDWTVVRLSYTFTLEG